jgi:hypothetical protein
MAVRILLADSGIVQCVSAPDRPEAGLYDFDLTRFLRANQYPRRSKTL